MNFYTTNTKFCLWICS